MRKRPPTSEAVECGGVAVGFQMPRAFIYALAAAITLSMLWSSSTTIRASVSARSSSDGAALAIVSFADGFFGLATGFGFAAFDAGVPGNEV